MLDLRRVLDVLRLADPSSRERCFVCGRGLSPQDGRLVMHGMRAHAHCAGYRMRVVARRERGRLTGVTPHGD